MMDELRKCPFCGGEAIIARETSRPAPELHKINSSEYAASPRPSVNDGWLAECKQCGTRGPHEYTMPVQSMDKAVAAWNSRPLESALEERVKGMEVENERLKTIAQAYAEKLDTAIATAPTYKAALEAITLGQAELAQARAAVKSLANMFELGALGDCERCPFKNPCCQELERDEACALAVEKWAYEATEEPK